MNISTEIIIVLALIVANGIFAMTELAIVNARKSRLEDSAEKGNKGAQLALELSENPNQMFSTIQIGITLISIITGLYSGATFSAPLADVLRDGFPSLGTYADSLSSIIIVSLTTYLSLVIGELVPKRLAYNAPEQVAIIMGRPMRWFSILMSPFIRLLSVSTDIILKIFGVQNKTDEPITESEINKMLTQGVELGAYEAEEPKLVDNIFRLADLSGVDIMTPRTQLEWVDLACPDEELGESFPQLHHSRLPVGDDSLDELKGIVVVADVLRRRLSMPKESWSASIEACLRQPLLVPESISLMKLLRFFQEEGVHEAILLDEFGGFSGLVTLHDILEEIVGLLPDGEEGIKEDESRIIQRSDTTWLVDGLLNVDDFKEYFHIDEDLPGEDSDLYKTMGGFMTYQFGRIARETDVYRWHGYTFEVMDMDNTRVDKIMVTYVPPVAETEEVC